MMSLHAQFVLGTLFIALHFYSIDLILEFVACSTVLLSSIQVRIMPLYPALFECIVAL